MQMTTEQAGNASVVPQQFGERPRIEQSHIAQVRRLTDSGVDGA